MAGSLKAQPVIVWFRRDLRLSDNPALMAALRMSPAVIPVYVFAPEEEGQFQPGRCSRWWLHKSLEALDQDLRALGSRLLCFRAADSLSLLAALAARLGAQAVLFNHLYDPISMVRDNEVKAGLVAAGLYCQSFNADILREPWETLDSAGRPFTSYDAFWTAHCRLPYPPPPPLPMPAAMPPLPAGLGLEAGAVELAELCIMTPEEEMSNMQLDYHAVGSADTGVHFSAAECFTKPMVAAPQLWACCQQCKRDSLLSILRDLPFRLSKRQQADAAASGAAVRVPIAMRFA